MFPFVTEWPRGPFLLQHQTYYSDLIYVECDYTLRVVIQIVGFADMSIFYGLNTKTYFIPVFSNENVL